MACPAMCSATFGSRPWQAVTTVCVRRCQAKQSPMWFIGCFYLENDDLCKRLIDLNENIYIAPKSKIKHLGASGTSKKYSYQVEISRNWHWMWSKFYFKRKHYGYLNALISGFPKFLSSILKFLFYTVFRKQNKREIYFNRASGYLNALLGNKSTYRPKLD